MFGSGRIDGVTANKFCKCNELCRIWRQYLSGTTHLVKEAESVGLFSKKKKKKNQVPDWDRNPLPETQCLKNRVVVVTELKRAA